MIWNFDPQIFSFFSVRWYGVLFVGGFALGVYIFRYILKKQGYALYEEITNKFLIYAILGTALGSRLGHVFFYQWDYYSQHPLEILQIWKGGLASHGGVIGMILAVLLFIVLHGKQFKISAWMLFDALIVPALLVSAFIRLGNFCNSEILGVQTRSDKGIVFCGDFYSSIYHLDKAYEKPDVFIERTGPGGNGKLPVRCTLRFDSPAEKVATYLFAQANLHSDNFNFTDAQLKTENVNGKWCYSMECTGILRHPAQLYESVAYLLLFVIAMLARKKLFRYPGVSFGLFLASIFLFRFFVEFIKIDQVEAEKEMVLNIGQRLSIPMVAACLAVAAWCYFRGRRAR